LEATEEIAAARAAPQRAPALHGGRPLASRARAAPRCARSSCERAEVTGSAPALCRPRMQNVPAPKPRQCRIRAAAEGRGGCSAPVSRRPGAAQGGSSRMRAALALKSAGDSPRLHRKPVPDADQADHDKSSDSDARPPGRCAGGCQPGASPAVRFQQARHGRNRILRIDRSCHELSQPPLYGSRTSQAGE
jgi:hypothetical protein